MKKRPADRARLLEFWVILNTGARINQATPVRRRQTPGWVAHTRERCERDFEVLSVEDLEVIREMMAQMRRL